MAQFIVRNLEEHVYKKIRELAVSRGQSTEEFVSELIRGVALETDNPHLRMGTRLTERFSSCGLQDEDEIIGIRGSANRHDDTGKQQPSGGIADLPGRVAGTE